jgi:hypothetical protein
MNRTEPRRARPVEQREASVRAERRPGEVRRARCRATVVAGALLVVASLTSCTSRTKVEIDSARSPTVEPVGVEIDGATDTTLVAEPAPSTTDPRPTESSDSPATTQPATAGTIDPATADECEADHAMLERAIANFRGDTGVAPASEAELVIDGYMRRFSQLYDVQYNGTIVAQGSPCAGAE